jgi:selenocysteine lyase/cysteine desulfurase
MSSDSSIELSEYVEKHGYGHAILPKEFLLRSGLLNFNHGSFGTVPKDVMERHVQLLHEQESCPEDWFRRVYFNYVNESRQKIAELINAHVDDVVIVENASAAVNGILRSFPFESGDIVLVFSSAYQMVTETLLFQEVYQQVKMISIPIEYPVKDPQELILAFSSIIQQLGNQVKLCIFSHISSMVSSFLNFSRCFCC